MALNRVSHESIERESKTDYIRIIKDLRVALKDAQAALAYSGEKVTQVLKKTKRYE